MITFFYFSKSADEFLRIRRLQLNCFPLTKLLYRIIINDSPINLFLFTSGLRKRLAKREKKLIFFQNRMVAHLTIRLKPYKIKAFGISSHRK
jgi:hypothetical protein